MFELFASGPFAAGAVVGAIGVAGAVVVKGWQDRDMIRPRLAARSETRKRAAEQRRVLNQAAPAGAQSRWAAGTGKGGQFAGHSRSESDSTLS